MKAKTEAKAAAKSNGAVKLTNGDIYGATSPRQLPDGKSEPGPLQLLLDQRFPIFVSYRLAKLAQALQGQASVIEQMRVKLIRAYGEADGSGNVRIKANTPEATAFNEEFAEVLNEEAGITVDKVRLPLKVAATCDKCHHNMDKDLEIEPRSLMLLEKFIEVIE